MDDESKPYTAFTCMDGHFEYNQMSFGLCGAPPLFQRLMDRVLTNLNHKTALVYLDDILIYSDTFPNHLRDLKEVLQRFRDHGLKVKIKKCHFPKKEVQYLGHLISSEGVKPDPNNTAKVRDFPVPSTVKQVRSFIGLCSYYRRLIPGFAKIAAPLQSMVKKDQKKIVWNDEAHDAFQKLKTLLISEPLIAFP